MNDVMALVRPRYVYFADSRRTKGTEKVTIAPL